MPDNNFIIDKRIVVNMSEKEREEKFDFRCDSLIHTILLDVLRYLVRYTWLLKRRLVFSSVAQDSIVFDDHFVKYLLEELFVEVENGTQTDDNQRFRHDKFADARSDVELLFV